MNGPHDMGGFTGFGAVAAEPREPVFHATWESKVFALVNALSSTNDWPANRPIRESLPALQYWNASYYEIWLAAMERVLVERGILDAPDQAQRPEWPVTGVPSAAAMTAMLQAGAPEDRATMKPPKHAVGGHVRTRNFSPAHHTRLPRFARGRAGEIASVHGTFAYPDSQVCGRGDDPQWLYSVRFPARELWGKDSRDFVHLDLWEPYLEEPA